VFAPVQEPPTHQAHSRKVILACPGLIGALANWPLPLTFVTLREVTATAADGQDRGRDKPRLVRALARPRWSFDPRPRRGDPFIFWIGDQGTPSPVGRAGDVRQRVPVCGRGALFSRMSLCIVHVVKAVMSDRF
jgi:hypothetical protein